MGRRLPQQSPRPSSQSRDYLHQTASIISEPRTSSQSRARKEAEEAENQKDPYLTVAALIKPGAALIKPGAALNRTAS